MYNSIVQERGNISFPVFAGERIHMQPFKKQIGLPLNLKHWQSTVDAMLEGIDVDEEIYLMIDQKEIKANNFHRREGLHVDGYWIPNLSAHGGGGHSGSGSGGGSHSGKPSHRLRKSESNNNWEGVDFSDREAIILASNIQACRAFNGIYNADILEGGACENIDISNATEIILKPNKVYAGNVSMLHESLPVPFDCFRTVVRLNVPSWSPTLN